MRCKNDKRDLTKFCLMNDIEYDESHTGQQFCKKFKIQQNAKWVMTQKIR